MKGTSIKNLSFSYPGDTRLILKDIDLEVEAGEFVCLLGQSGCGKSTLLRLLAGLEKPTMGEISQDGKPIEGAGLDRGVVFQSYGLFPWMTAGNNIMLALKQRYTNMTKQQHKEIALKAIRAVGLKEDVFNKLPKELSGGMKQRCAIAQAFAINPAVLLMDEPFGALDAVTRARLQDMVLELWASQEQKKTVFFVTHDDDEALLLVIAMALSLVACGSKPAAEAPAADVAMQYIKHDEAKELLNSDEYVFFDIRKAADSSANSIPGAQAWDMDAAKEGDAEAGKATMTEATKGLDKKIILVCYSGKRYAQAATNALSAIGYDMSKVFTLEGGFTNWSEKLPELTTAGGAAVEAPKTDAPELSKIRLNWGGSGNILWALAIENGYLADEGIEVEFVQATNNDDMLTLLQTGVVDICTNAGTADPLKFIAAGADFTIFGGRMVQGCMPIIAKPGTEWEGVESFVGEKVGIKPNYFAVTGALMELGYEDPLSAAEFLNLNYNDALAALMRDEIKYALVGTSQNFPVKQLVEEGQVEIVAWHGDVMPNYSCCRMEATTEFVNNNPNTIKAILRALLRAQCYFEANKSECPPVLANIQGVDVEVVEAFMLNDEYYKPHLDPLRNGIVRAWNILDATGFLDENAKQINIEDHINTTLYEEALAEYAEIYGAEDPAFVQRMQDFYNEWDK